ncbi:MAG TPA: hypothetical protein VNE58_15800 [Casimicrobiaceae bacterium]|nr:hypothetical protein [Casimicrobiaceae bacterium]
MPASRSTSLIVEANDRNARFACSSRGGAVSGLGAARATDAMLCSRPMIRSFAASISTRVVYAIVAAVLAACVGTPEKPEEVPSKDTFECRLEGERWLVRFTEQEARLLTPQGERINLYQIASGSGVRFTNGIVELRGRGSDLTLIRENFAREMVDCKPLMVPVENPNPMMRALQPPKPGPLGK